jgi:two-component system, chemotaxis family, response regulator Rcp1
MTIADIKIIDILVVEDNPGDTLLIREILKSTKIYNTFHIVKDGFEAMEFLHRRGKYAGVSRPDLVLLDINLPKKDGWEVLAEIKSDKELKDMAVAVMTNSPVEEEILRSRLLNADCFVSKPIDLDQFGRAVEAIESLWFILVKLPVRAA